MIISALSPWPFKLDEKVILHWVSSPIYQNGGFFIEAVFKSLSEFKSIIYPFEFLPLLFIGIEYKNGKITKFREIHSEFHFNINSNTNQLIVKASDVLPDNLYPLKMSKTFQDEKCVLINLGNKKIIIPCIEILRTIYAPYNFLTNRLLSTTGLEELSLNERIINNTIHIDFSNDYPITLLKSKWINYLIWLKYSQKSSWYKIKDQFLLGYKTQVILPFNNGERIIFEDIHFKDYIFATNLRVEEISFPFQSVEYTHPGLIQKMSKNESKYHIKQDLQEEIGMLGPL